MGKGKAHNKMYVTATEWVEHFGGKKLERDSSGEFKKLPYYCCALSLQPFKDPVCTPDGTVFDILNIVPWIQKHGTNPVTNEPLKMKDLITLHFHKNAEGEYHDPVSFKVFTDHTHIVAIKTSGNVYSYDTVQKMNIKTKNWTDLLTGEPFTKQDIITIQDPHNLSNRDLSKFHHIQNDMKLPSQEEEEERMRNDPTYNIKANDATARILKQISSSSSSSSSTLDDKKKSATATATTTNAATPKPKPAATPAAAEPQPRQSTILYTSATTGDNTMSSSFTSSAMNIVTKTKKPEATVWDKRQPVYERVAKLKKKGYVALHTNMGDINIELHCDIASKTTDNFLGLCESGYYNGVIFHRLIPGFMIQGGDPTGTGRGGESVWKNKFPDEFSPKLKHDERGVLSMANSGKNTNGSQFFITFAACTHLNNKHSVFGRVVGGLDVLGAMEAVPTDKQDRPKQEIKIMSATVYVNPFTEAAEAIAEEEKKAAYANSAEAKERGQWFSNPIKKIETTKTGIGKYIGASTTATTGEAPKSASPTPTSSVLDKRARSADGASSAESLSSTSTTATKKTRKDQ